MKITQIWLTIISIRKCLRTSPLSSIVRITQGLCLSMSIVMFNSSYAQSRPDIEAAQRQAEIIQRQEQERLKRDQEEIRRRTEPVEGMDTKSLQPKIEVPSIGAHCREINEIVINGAPHLSSVVRERITTEFTGRCLNASDIEHILGEITKDYIDQGYVTTRAYLEPQDLSKGRLEILVVEGTVEKIMLEDGNTNSVSIGNVFPGIEGNLLNLRDLEQGIDQINRLASNSALLDIDPGTKPGTSRVVVYNQPRSPFHFFASYDNQGYESTGKTQVGLSAGVDNLLGFNEMFYATHRQSVPGDIDSKDSGSDSLNFSIPFGYTTFSMGTNYSRYANMIQVPSGLELLSTGTNKINSVRLDRVMYRNRLTRAALAATITTKESRNFLERQFLEISSRNLTLLDLEGHFHAHVGAGTLSLNLGYTQGLNAMGALDDPDSLPDDAPRAQFRKFTYGFTYAIPFKLLGKDLSFITQLAGQKSKDVLFGSEQISIGGLYSVRGFVGNTLLGDDGYYVRNELSVRQPLVIGNETITSRIYAGYDTGEVWNRVDNIPQGRLAGMVIGISINLRGATLDLFNTRPLSLPGFMTKESNQTWFRIAYAL